MEKTLIEMAASQGIWAVLFVALLFYVLRNSQAREERLVAERKESEAKAAAREEKIMSHLGELSGLCREVDEVREDVNEIKGDIKELKGKVCAATAARN